MQSWEDENSRNIVHTHTQTPQKCYHFQVNLISEAWLIIFEWWWLEIQSSLASQSTGSFSEQDISFKLSKLSFRMFPSWNLVDGIAMNELQTDGGGLFAGAQILNEQSTPSLIIKTLQF